MNIEKKIFAKLKKIKTQSLIVACSGGADSMCLTLIAKKFATQNDIELCALIVDHGLRNESASEAKRVKSYLKNLGINSEILKWQHSGVDSNIHKKARDARYSLMAEYCKSKGVKTLLVAHNKEDQAETVMIRILRGTGVDGLGSIKLKSRLNGISIYRPMLDISRDDIEEYLAASSIDYVNDPSNENDKFKRVKVRRLLREMRDSFGVDVYSRLNLLADNANTSSNYLKHRAKTLEKKIITNTQFGVFYLDLNEFSKLHKELKLRLIKSILGKLSLKEYSPRLDSLKELLRRLSNKSANCMLNGVRVLFFMDKAIFFMEESSKNELLVKPGEVRYFAGVEIENTYDKPIVARSLGADGWKDLKRNGFQKPKNLRAEVIKSSIAIYDIKGNLLKSLVQENIISHLS